MHVLEGMRGCGAGSTVPGSFHVLSPAAPALGWLACCRHGGLSGRSLTGGGPPAGAPLEEAAPPPEEKKNGDLGLWNSGF